MADRSLVGLANNLQYVRFGIDLKPAESVREGEAPSELGLPARQEPRPPELTPYRKG